MLEFILGAIVGALAMYFCMSDGYKKLGGK
jgi:hypothetical protein